MGTPKPLVGLCICFQCCRLSGKHDIVDVYVAARSHKSSTGSRSSDRRNVLVFRRSAFSQNDDDDIDDDEINMSDEKLPVSVPASSQGHADSRALKDTSVDDAARNDAQSEQSTQAAAATAVAIMTGDSVQVLSSDVPQSSNNSNTSTRTSITDPTKLSSVTEQDASSVSADTTPRGLTKGEIPTFVSLNTSPSTVKKSSTVANRVGHRDRKGDDGRGKTSKYTGRSRKKKTAASEKIAIAKSDSRNFDDRRLTFVVNKTRPVEESAAAVPTSPKKTRSGSIVRDHLDADVENIMDQTDEILQDVSDCSEPFPGEDSNTLVPSVSDNSSLTLMPDHACASASGMPSSAGFPPLTVAFASNVYSQPADAAGESPAGNVTSLVVTDMEMTSINTSKSPQLFGNVSNDTPETASDSTTKSKTGSCCNAEETVDYREAQKDDQEPTGDIKKGRSKSKSRNTTTLSKRTKSSTFSAACENVNSLDDKSDVEHPTVGQSHQQSVGVRQKQSVCTQSKHRTTTLQASTVCSSADDAVAIPDDGGKKKSTNSKDISAEATVAPHNSDTQQKHQISKLSMESLPKVATAGEVEEQTAEVLPKKVAAYMTKPGKIVYSTAHRRSASSEPALGKSRSKSRSILPLQSRPRSKQPLVFADHHADSPPSAFAFDGTPKEDTVCPPAAMLAARKKYMLLDDSVLVSEPAEKRPVMRQRSLSSDDAASSPHGIMLVLHNGKRTKPRTARSKSVRYGASETVCTPPASTHRKQLDVPLTPYARASEAPTSESTDLDNAVAGIVPESPVFTTASPLQQTSNEDVSQSTVIAASSRTEDQTLVHEKSNVDQV